MTAREKLEKIYEMYALSMYRVAYSILNSVEQAEDVVSESIIKIAENINKINDVDSEKTKHYVFKIIKNTSINKYRQNKRENERKQSKEIMCALEVGEEGYEKVENAGVIEEMLNSVPEQYREIDSRGNYV